MNGNATAYPAKSLKSVLQLTGVFGLASYSPLLLTGLLLLHIVGINLSSPFSELNNGHPYYTDDHPFLFYNAATLSELWSQTKSFWVYDPYLMAGYPLGGYTNVSNNMAVLFMILTPFLDKALSFKLYVILCAALFPVSVYWSARNFALTRGEALIAAALATVLFYTGKSPIQFGLIGFFAVSYLSLLVFSLFYRYSKSRSLYDYSWLLLVSPLVFVTHIFTPVILLVPLTVIFLTQIKTSPVKYIFSVVIWAALIIGVNWFWLAPLLQFRQHIEEFTALLLSGGLVDLGKTLTGAYGYGVSGILIAPGLYGLYVLLKRDIKLGLSFLFALVALFYLGFFGSSSAVVNQTLDPGRFVTTFAYFLSIPAAVGMAELTQQLWDKLSKVHLLIFCGMLFPIFFSSQVFRPIATHIKGGSRIASSLPPAAHQLLGWIDSHTTRGGRILLEDYGHEASLESCKEDGHIYFGGHFPALLPRLAKREFIGGPLPGMGFKQQFADFYSGTLFRRDIVTYTEEELRSYLEAYNIKWIIAWSDKAKKYLASRAGYIEFMDEIELRKCADDSLSLYFYEVKRQPNFFLVGSGRVKADYNRIEVTDAAPGRVVLKYHWLETLKTDPPLPLRRFPVLNDPVGFIEVENANIASFAIVNTH